MRDFSGPALFLDRADINTDEIIPAKYLSEISRQAMGPHLFEDLRLTGFDARRDLPGKRVVVARENFGCGSSREHAPWALEANGIHLVIAPSFARIFRRNMFNCGMLAVALPAETVAQLFERFAGVPTEVSADMPSSRLHFIGGGAEQVVEFALSAFERGLVEEGGWLAYAERRY